MDIIQARWEFSDSKKIYDKALLRFYGTEGWDVYNCSIPFDWQGKRYIFGRVERREDFANSTAWLFEKVGEDVYRPVPGSAILPLEDPFIQVIHGELILGGTHVRKSQGEIDELRAYFYRGTDVRWLTHFTCGPANMKDVRLVELEDGRIGVFSRPRNEEIEARYGSGAMVGFTIIDTIEQLNAEVIENASYIEGLFDKGEWGGCNQCYLLKDGRIGVIGHRSYKRMNHAWVELQVYVNISFIFDYKTFTVSNIRIIGDKPSYPDTEYMLDYLEDCAFTSGIVMREDGKADLYSGLGDVAEGRITIDAPFGELL